MEKLLYAAFSVRCVDKKINFAATNQTAAANV